MIDVDVTRCSIGSECSQHVARVCDHLYQEHQLFLVRFARKQGCDEHESMDMVQELFLRLLRNGHLLPLEDKPDEMKRAYLIQTLRWMISNQRRHKTTHKRGAGQEVVSVDKLIEEGHEVSTGDTPATDYDRAWATSVMERGMQRLRVSLGARKWDSIAPALFMHEAVPSAAARSSSAGRVALHRARARLRGYFAIEAGNEGDIEAAKAALIQAAGAYP